MSYAIRNSLILAGLILLIWAGGYGYLMFWLDPDAEEKLSEIRAMESQVEDFKLVADRHDEVYDRHLEVLDKLESYPKQYVSGDEIDRLYDLVRRYNDSETYTELDYSLKDSEEQDEQTAEITLEGKGRYDHLAGFIQTIELEPALIRINSVRVDPISDTDQLGFVRFNLELETYISEEPLDLGDDQDDQEVFAVNLHSWDGGNPFFPGIHEPLPNTENLPDIRDARISGVTSNRVWVRLSDGTAKTMRPGEEVYMGRLTSIDAENGKVEFTLNEGGIVNKYILEL